MKGKYDRFLNKGFLFDWLIFLPYLLQSVYCSEYSAKTTNFSILNLFLHFLHSLLLKHFIIFVTAMRSKFHCLLKFSTRGFWKGILLILSSSVLLAWYLNNSLFTFAKWYKWLKNMEVVSTWNLVFLETKKQQ